MSITPELSTLITGWPILLLAGLVLVELIRLQRAAKMSDRRPILIALEKER